MEIPKLTKYFGFLLILIGLASYFGSGMVSITALIPAFFGVIFLAGGILAGKQNFRKVVMHIMVVVAVIALVGTFSGLISFFGYLGGTEVERPVAVTMQAVVAVLMIIYLIFAIKSFIDARRRPGNKSLPET